MYTPACLSCRPFLGTDVVRRPFDAEALLTFSHTMNPSRRWAMTPGEQAGIQARLGAGTGGSGEIISYHCSLKGSSTRH